MDDGPSAPVPATCVGNKDKAPVPWPEPGTVLPFVAICGEKRSLLATASVSPLSVTLTFEKSKRF